MKKNIRQAQVACWLKCWPTIERLQVQASLDTGFFTYEYTVLFGGDVKLSVPGSWLILATRSYSRFLVKPYFVKSLGRKSDNKTIGRIYSGVYYSFLRWIR